MEISNKKLTTPGFGHGLLVILISALLSLIAGGIGLLIVKFIPEFKPWNMLFSYVLIYGLTLYGAMLVWQNKKIETNKTSIIIFLMLLPATIGMSIITESIVSLIPMPQIVADLFASMIQLDLPGYLTIGIAAAILEELIFRGVILKGFLKKYNPTRAIVFSSLLFGIAHLNPWQFVAAFIAGLVIGWVYYKTQSIWPGIFIHFVNNTFSFYIGVKFNDINISFYDIAGGFLNYLALIIASLVICYLVYLQINKLYLKPNRSET